MATLEDTLEDFLIGRRDRYSCPEECKEDFEEYLEQKGLLSERAKKFIDSRDWWVEFESQEE